MIDFLTMGDKTYRLEAVISECTCDECEEYKSEGYQTYQSNVYLGDMLIGSDCVRGTEEDALDAAQGMAEMFDNGELGADCTYFFTSEAIKQVRMRWVSKQSTEP